MKKVFTLLTLLVAMTTSAWAADYTLAAGTFNSAKNIATVDGVEFQFSKAHGGGGQTGYTDYIKFSKNATYTITLPDGFKLTNINIKGYTNSNGKTNGEITSIGGEDQTGKTFPARDDANLATNACITDGYDFAISQTGGTVSIVTANTNQICVLITITGTAPAAVAVDPEFSLARTSISAIQTTQIRVGTKEGLDGITLSDITYGTAGVVTVDADGVVTAVAAGTTTINFSSSEVKDKYNASTGNSLSITVTKPVLVFDAAGLYNQEILLSKANVEDKDYLSCDDENWVDKGWSSPYNGNFLDMKTDRKITFKVKNADAFELYVNGTSGRTYTIKVGDADAVEYTQGDGSFVSSGIIETGTTDEVTIEIEGGSSSLYPVYFNVNPAATITPAKEYTTLTSANALDFTGSSIEAYIVKDDDASDGVITLTQVNKVPANTGLVLKASEPGTAVNVPFLKGDADDVTGNKMTGSATETTEITANGGYILKDGKFHPANAGSLAKGKAYLKIAVSAAAPVMSFDSEGSSTTAIDTIEKSTIKNGVYYNLAGQRVAQPTKGLYIVNGKKVIVK